MPCLVLDAMGVIFKSADDVAELLIPFIAENAGTTDQALIESTYHVASLGQIDAVEFWSRVGVEAEHEDAYLARHRLNPGVLDLLNHARENSIPVGCLSNDLGSWSTKLRNRQGVEEFLELSVISGDVGIRKPDAEIYQTFVETSGYLPAELLFVDDRMTNVEAARNLGIETVHFDPVRGFQEVQEWITGQ